MFPHLPLPLSFVLFSATWRLEGALHTGEVSFWLRIRRKRGKMGAGGTHVNGFVLTRLTGINFCTVSAVNIDFQQVAIANMDMDRFKCSTCRKPKISVVIYTADGSGSFSHSRRTLSYNCSSCHRKVGSGVAITPGRACGVRYLAHFGTALRVSRL